MILILSQVGNLYGIAMEILRKYITYKQKNKQTKRIEIYRGLVSGEKAHSLLCNGGGSEFQKMLPWELLW